MSALRFVRLILSLEPRRSIAGLGLLALLTATEGLGLLSLGGLVAQAGLDGAAATGPFRWLETLLGRPPGFDLLLGLFLVAVVGRALVAYAFGELSGRIMSGLLHKLRMRLYRAVSNARWDHVQSARRAELHHALSMAPNELAYGVDITLRLAVALCVVLVAGGLAVSVDASIVIALGAVTAALAAPMLWFDRRIARQSRETFRATERLYDHVARYLDNLKLDRFLTASDPGGGDADSPSSEFERVSRRQAEMARQVARIGLQSDLVHQLGGAVALAAIIWIAAGSGLSLGEGALIVVLFMRLLPRLMAAHGLLQDLIATSGAFAEYERQVAEFAAAAEPRAPAPPRPSGPPRIEAENLRYAYPGAASDALRGVSLTLPAGSATALLGLSGAGKTTLADILCGLLTPKAGCLKVDGRPLEEADLAAWRARTSLVSRDDFLVPDTLRANLTMGSPEADDAAAWEALKLVGFDARAAAMGGLDAPVGDRGDRLSAGERQRICLARAILRRPDFLALDEATSAMNPLDEAQIVGRLAALRGGMTILVIAHRLSSVGWVDRIAVLEEGRLTAAGPREDMARHGFLGRMEAAGDAAAGPSSPTPAAGA